MEPSKEAGPPPSAAPVPSAPADRGALLGCGQLLLPLALGASLLAGVILGGGWLREQLRDRGPAICNFADIECPSPPGLSREDFLAEVQFLGNLPDRFN